MRVSDVEFRAAGSAPAVHASAADDPVRRFVEVLPRPLRFVGVGGLVSYSGQALFAFRPRRSD
jgi:hypothetical protein